MSLAIFDLDDTLTTQDTETLWVEFLVYKQLISQHAVNQVRLKFQEDYEQGVLNFHDVIAFSLTPIAHLSLQEQQALRREYQQTYLRYKIPEDAIQLVNDHTHQGHTVVVISAGNEFLIPLACEFFPVDYVFCTGLKRNDLGAFLPELEGPALYREQKLIKLKQWLATTHQHFDKTYFYSDSINDLPLLEWVDIPVAVNPCPQLTQYAQAHNWKIIHLKDHDRAVALL